MADFAGLTNIESIWEIFATPLISIFNLENNIFLVFFKNTNLLRWMANIINKSILAEINMFFIGIRKSIRCWYRSRR